MFGGNSHRCYGCLTHRTARRSDIMFVTISTLPTGLVTRLHANMNTCSKLFINHWLPIATCMYLLQCSHVCNAFINECTVDKYLLVISGTTKTTTTTMESQEATRRIPYDRVGPPVKPVSARSGTDIFVYSHITRLGRDCSHRNVLRVPKGVFSRILLAPTECTFTTSICTCKHTSRRYFK